MKNSRSISKLIGAILIVPISFVILPAIIYADQGIIITLENTGKSPITDAELGFDLQPLDPGQTLDVTVGMGTFLPSNIGAFQIGVIPISEDNPLAPGETACVGPLYQLTSGDYIELEGVSSFGNGFGPPGSFELIPDVTTLPFDLHDYIEWGQLAGVFRFFSSVPDSCKTGYSPPFGKMKINEDAVLTTSTSADLSVNCYPTVGYICQEMQFSNDNLNWSAPEPYARNRTWILLPGDGEKTVYVKFKDDSGNWSNAYSDTIIIGTLTPNGGESIPSGSVYTIHWVAPPHAVAFDLQYSINNGSTWKTIAKKVTGTSYYWHVPIPSNNKTSCLFKVIGFDSSGSEVGERISDSAFTIEVVNITSPAGGEILKSGNTWAITWQTNGTIRHVTSVKLLYSINGGASWKTIKTVNRNPGSYNWPVPNITSSSCKVKVILKSDFGATVGNSISDGLFTIQP
jgi:hypothetical protein